MVTDKNKKDKNPQEEPETTGHEWDGIQEYNNPLPRWWVWVFIVTVVWSIGYCIVYPSWPGISRPFQGIAGWSQYGQLEQSMSKAVAMQAPFNEKIASQSASKIMADSGLRDFAVAGGKAAFALHCSQCHGSGAQGGEGYPNLLDDEWIWGGTIEDIEYTIRHGVRSMDDEDTRQAAVMQGFGKDGLLSKEEILDVIHHIRFITGQEKKRSHEGASLFAQNCASCHGNSGEGMHEFGAPALNNRIWLYGGSEDTLYETIYYGRGGMMPHWGEKLDDVTIKKLAIYIHSLSGGEQVPE